MRLDMPPARVDQHETRGDTMNRSAQQLGRLAKGKPKTLTKAERNRRAMSLAVARAKRWPNKSNGELTGTVARKEEK